MRKTTRLGLATLVLLGAMAAPGFAAEQPAAPQRQAAADNVKLGIKEYRLKNGLRLLMLQDHKAPVVTVQVWYQVGSKDERPGITGVSHLLEHMMFQGAKKYGTGQFDKQLVSVGGQNNAFTTEDYTAYYEALSSDNVELAFDLESDRMMGALLPADKLKSEVNVVKEERRQSTENSPVSMGLESLNALAYFAHPYHWPVVGWMSDLETMQHQQVVDYYRAFYRPDNATLVVVGDIDPDKIIALAERYFGHLAPAGQFPRNTTQEPPQEGERRAELIKDVQTPVVLAGYHVPRAGHPDLYALALLDTILSKGQSSRLYQELIYKGRLAQDVGSWVSENKDGSMFVMYGMPMPGKSTAALEKALYAQIERLKTQPVTDQELQKALNAAESSFIFGQESSQDLAVAIGTRDSLTRYQDLNEYLPRLRAVTKQDLMRVAKTYMVPTNRTVVTVRSGEEK